MDLIEQIVFFRGIERLLIIISFGLMLVLGPYLLREIALKTDEGETKKNSEEIVKKTDKNCFSTLMYITVGFMISIIIGFILLLCNPFDYCERIKSDSEQLYMCCSLQKEQGRHKKITNLIKKIQTISRNSQDKFTSEKYKELSEVINLLKKEQDSSNNAIVHLMSIYPSCEL